MTSREGGGEDVITGNDVTENGVTGNDVTENDTTGNCITRNDIPRNGVTGNGVTQNYVTWSRVCEVGSEICGVWCRPPPPCFLSLPPSHIIHILSFSSFPLIRVRRSRAE